MESCVSCPAKLMADLFELLGDTDRATEVREAGCSWWWSIQEENIETGQTRTREACGREMLPHFLRSFGMDIARSANAVRSDAERVNGVGESLRALNEMIVPSLPPHVE